MSKARIDKAKRMKPQYGWAVVTAFGQPVRVREIYPSELCAICYESDFNSHVVKDKRIARIKISEAPARKGKSR